MDLKSRGDIGQFDAHDLATGEKVAILTAG